MTDTAMAGRADLDVVQRRQALIIGWLLLALAVFVAAVFGAESSGEATFRLALGGRPVRAARPHRAGLALQLRGGGDPGLSRRPPVRARRRQALEPLSRHRPRSWR